MNLARIQSESSTCCNIFSPCRFFVTIPKRFFLFLRDIFLEIAATFSTPPKKKIRVIERSVVIKEERKIILPLVVESERSLPVPAAPPASPVSPPILRRDLTPIIEEDGVSRESPAQEAVPEQKPVALVAALASVPVPRVISHKEGMLLAMGELIHPDMARIFESLLIGLDVIRLWNYNEGDGSYRIELSQTVKVWVPKGIDADAPGGGTVVQFGPVILGKFENLAKTIHFDSGFEFECLFWLPMTVYIKQITYCTHTGKIDITAGRFGQYQNKLKEVHQLVRDWGNIGNRR